MSIPARPVPDHSIENGEQLTHTSGKRHLLSLASSKKSLIKSLNDRVGLGCNKRRHVEGAPLIDGFARNIVGGRVSQLTGHGTAHGKNTLKPDGVNGRWEGNFQVEMNDNGMVVHSVDKGTGELEGMILKYTVEMMSDMENPCDSSEFVGRVSGEIIGSQGR